MPRGVHSSLGAPRLSPADRGEGDLWFKAPGSEGDPSVVQGCDSDYDSLQIRFHVHDRGSMALFVGIP